MLRAVKAMLSRLFLGAAARAGHQVLDVDTRIAMPPGAIAPAAPEEAHIVAGRQVGHLVVFEGGRGGRRLGNRHDGGPLGRPIGLDGGTRTAGRRS